MAVTTNINWINLVNSLRNQECILVLGPSLATIEHDGQAMPLAEVLADELAHQLRQLRPGLSLRDSHSLAYVAKELEDAYLPQCNYSTEKARSRVGALIREFYDRYDHSQFPVYQKLAQLPFRFVVNTSPDHFLVDAYCDENKLFTKSEYYHYRNPRHNNGIDILEEDITAEAPLVYNLFGALDSPDSIVITEGDQLFFLDAILQREQTATIPPSIAIHFAPVEKYHYEKTFVFLGFDFNQWHLRLLMHLINRYQRQKESYALQNPQSLSELTTFFYKRNFEVEFVDILAWDFLDTFRQKLDQEQAQSKKTPQLRVFLLYHPDDKTLKDRLDLQLAPLKKKAFIQTWDEEQILPGAEPQSEIQKQMNVADIIILVVTPLFFASDGIYKEQLQWALQRHESREAVVIPILMQSSMWESSALRRLATILPRNKRPLNEQENESAALNDTIDQLKKICHMIYKRNQRNQNRRIR